MRSLLKAFLAGLILFPAFLSRIEAAPRFVRVETSLGPFVLQLDPDRAPVTVANFFRYLQAGFYDNTIFHRSTHDPLGSGGDFKVVQGGGFDVTAFRGVLDGSVSNPTTKDTQDPIVNEASNGLSNLRGSIAMARTDNPDSATSQFYVNVSDNTFLDYDAASGRAGYAVFGQVIEGMEVVDAISGLKVLSAAGLVDPVPAVFKDLPLDASDPASPAAVAIVRAAELVPAASAGSMQTVNEGAAVQLDGSASSDPAGKGLTYLWTQTGGPAVALAEAGSARPSFTAPDVMADTVLGFRLTVTDGYGTTGSTTVPVIVRKLNQAPVIRLDPVTVKEKGTVNLEAAVTDPDGDSLRYAWYQIAGTSVTDGTSEGPKLNFTAPNVADSEELEFGLVVRDSDTRNPLTTVGTVKVSVTNDPALLDCSRAKARQEVFGAAGRGFRRVTLTGIDAPARRFRLYVIRVTSDEPVTDRAARDLTQPDASIVPGIPSVRFPEVYDYVYLRAERQRKRPNGEGSGNGRVYGIEFVAQSRGQTCTGIVPVAVLGTGRKAVNDGQKYEVATRR